MEDKHNAIMASLSVWMLLVYTFRVHDHAIHMHARTRTPSLQVNKSFQTKNVA